MRQTRSFTLLELLIVIAIIAALSAFSLHALKGAIIKTEIARARTDIETLKVALTSYAADHRGHPRLTPISGAPDALLADDAPALVAGLRNKPLPELGGGAGGPYLDAQLPLGVLVDRAVLSADAMGKDGRSGARPLTEDERALAWSAAFQRAHHPGSPEPLVLLDPWGNPYHYREWASVRQEAKEALLRTPRTRSGLATAPQPGQGGQAPLEGPVPDGPHDPEGFDLWSNGPNGINEYGAPGSDDVTSWN